MLTSLSRIFFALLFVQQCTQALSRPIIESRDSNSWNESCVLNSFTTTQGNATGIWPYLKYKSSTAKPPQLLINESDSELAPGFVFFGPENGGQVQGLKQQSPLIMSDDGDLVWAGPPGPSSNFRKQSLHGDSVITFWEGSGNAAASGEDGHGYGALKILDSNYNTIHTICPKNLHITLPPGLNATCVVDVHEQYITPNNTILITSYNITQANLTSVGGPSDGWVYDPLAVEVDINTNEAIWIWDPLEHVPIDSTHYPLLDAGLNSSNPYDWFHMNSIQTHGSNVFINARQTWASYYVDRSGDILWQIDGETGGDFGSLPESGHFSWEHHARIYDHGDNQLLLTYFADNNGLPIYAYPSAGLGLILDLPPNKNNPPRIYNHVVDNDNPVYAYAEGSYSILDDGSFFLGYGTAPIMKEFDSAGKVRWSAQFGSENLENAVATYRAYKYTWQATPQAEISLVVERAESGDGLAHCAGDTDWRGYISWNGATNVTSYAVYTGQNRNDLTKIGTVDRRGFETEFVVPSRHGFVQVTAIEQGRSNEVGKSAIVNIG